MTLVELVNSGNYSSIEEAHQAITAKNIPVADPDRWDWADINDLLGPVVADQMLQFLETHSMRSIALQLGGDGVVMSDPRVQEVLKQMGTQIPGALTLVQKTLSYTSLYEMHGLPEPTIHEVSDAWNWVGVEPDSWGDEVLLTLNKQADNSVNCFMRVTKVGFKDGKEVVRDTPAVTVNDNMLNHAVLSLVERFING
jgi:hypothetical protein